MVIEEDRQVVVYDPAGDRTTLSGSVIYEPPVIVVSGEVRCESFKAAYSCHCFCVILIHSRKKLVEEIRLKEVVIAFCACEII